MTAVALKMPRDAKRLPLFGGPRVRISLSPAASLLRTWRSLSEIAVFSSSAHPLLAAEICTHLKVPLLPTRIERYANDCLGVQLQAIG